MSDSAADNLRTLLTGLPKVELHRHLEGSLRLSTLAEVGRQYRIDVPSYNIADLRPTVQVMPDAPMTVENFLAKFAVMRKFYVSQEVIMRVVREAIEDAANDNVKYMELRFTPKTLTKAGGFTLQQVIDWVCTSTAEAQRAFDIKVRLIASMNRNEGAMEGERVVRAVLDRANPLIVGLDLAGQEEGYPANPFLNMFQNAQRAGLFITIHAGEWAGPSNIRYAVEKIGVTRVGHGVRILEDSSIVKVAREHGTVFEVCPTSNWHSGVIRRLEDHPLRDMDALGLKTTLNTDDPGISAIVLTDELFCAMNVLGTTIDYIKQATLNAARSAFLPRDERERLVDYFEKSIAHPDAI